MKQLKLFGLLLLSSAATLAQNGSGAIKGQILNDDNLPVIGATIKILQGDALVGGAMTDETGKYTYKPLNAGGYDIIVSSAETQTKRITDIHISPEKTTYVDVAVSTNSLETIEVVAFIKPAIDKSFINMKEINADDFLHMAVDRGNVIDAIVNISSEASKDSNGDLHVRGSRGDATAYYIDGVRTPGITGVAALSVENVAIITGGIPAQYGDITSGVIIVTTKDYFSGIQSKRMQSSYIRENKERVQREKNAAAEEKKRKKEIEEELKLEDEAKTKQN